MIPYNENVKGLVVMVAELKKALVPYFTKDETELNDSILDLVDTICKEKIEPFSFEMDAEGVKLENGKTIVHKQIPVILDEFRKNDIFGIAAPEEYGGTGLSTALYNTVLERVSRADASVSIYLALQGALIDYLNTYGSKELKEKYLPDLSSGKRLGGFLYTESGSGSDLGSVKTKAEKQGNQYKVNGSKIFISNAGIADTFSALFATDPSKGSRGLSAFIVDTRNQPGFKIARLEEKLGIHASPTGQIMLEDFTVPEENRLGEENRGLSIILFGLSASRIGIGAQATGIADAAYRKALQYSAERKQFKTRVIDFQNTQFKVADMATKIQIARNYYIYASMLKDQGKEFFKEASIAKLYASEIAPQVCYDAVQIHGGYGFVKDYDVERYYRDARITTIYEGTSEIQRLVISREEMNTLGRMK